MRDLLPFAAVASLLAACAVAPDAGRSCAELAEARAATQVEREVALLEEQESGLPHKSELRRQFIAMDGEKYRAAVRAECLRHRNLPAEDS